MTSASGFRSKPKHDRKNYLPLSGQVQNAQNSTVYIFGAADDVVEEEINSGADQIELSELRTRSQGGGGKRKKKTKHVEKEEQMVLIEKDINEGDTLLTFSLQYGCPVSELKRVNNLITEQDFYARRTLKVPMRQHGLLLEEEQNQQAEAGAFQNVNHVGPHLLNGHRHSDGSDNFSDCDDSQTEFVRAISIPGSLDGENKAAQVFFEKMDKDLHTILERTRTKKGTLEEVTSVLKETRFRPLAFPKKSTECQTDGATYGCTGRNVVLAMIIIVVAMPIIGIIYHFSKDYIHKQPP